MRDQYACWHLVPKSQKFYLYFINALKQQTFFGMLQSIGNAQEVAAQLSALSKVLKGTVGNREASGSIPTRGSSFFSHKLWHLSKEQFALFSITQRYENL